MPTHGETDPGPFLSALDWLEGLGEVPLNIAGAALGTKGTLRGAGRKLIDSVSSIPDAILPGDWLPQVAQREDDVTASEVADIDRAAHPGIAKAVDIVGGTIANPASWAGVGGPLRGVAEAGGRGVRSVAKQAFEALPEDLQRTGRNTAAGVRRTLNIMDIPAEEDAFLRKAKASGSDAARAAREEVKRIYADLLPAEREAVGEIAHGVNRRGSADRSTWNAISDPEEIIARVAPDRQDIVRKAVQERTALMHTLLDESPGAGIMRGDPARRNESYINRQFSGDYFDEGESPLTFARGGNKVEKGRVAELQTPEQLVKFLRDQDVDLEFDALAADMNRAEQQGRLAERGALGRGLAEKHGLALKASDGAQIPFMMNEPSHKTAITKLIQDIGKQPGMGDYAYKLKNAFEGVTPRSDNFFWRGLHKANKIFKGAATYGLLLPRISFDVRNRTSALWQALSDPQGRKTLPGNAKRVLSDLLGAFDDGVMKLTGSTSRRWGKSPLTKQLDDIEQAFKQSGGSTAKVRQILGTKEDGKFLQEALDNGVLNNFVDSEELLTRMAKTKGAQRALDILEWPAEIAQGLEQRMRLGTYLDLRKNGIAKTPEEAAKTIRDTFLDYDVVGKENRTLRQIFPFASFLTQNAKQQTKFLAEQPAVGVAAAQLYGDDEGLPKYPWLEQQMTLPGGLDEQGNAQYISGLGLPIEGLTAIPGLSGDDIYRDVVGAIQPVLKSGVAYAVDKDPLTGREFGSYDKILGRPMGEAGRAYNVLKGTGLTQPITGPFGQFENALDDRKSIAERVLQGTTGARFTSVDADLAERQQLEQYLKSRPDVRTAESLYQTTPDPETQAKLKQLREAKDRLREKRAAAAAM